MTQLAAQLVLALKISEQRRGGLIAQRDRAVELNRSKTRLLATVGHDLRQPLTVITGILDMLSGRQGTRDWKLLAHAETAIARLARAFDLMMEVGRLELGNVQPNIRPTNLGSLFDELRDEHRKDAERKGFAFRVVSSDLIILTDPELLGSILHNLVGNAVKYTDRGGVLVGCRRRGDHVLIQVWDTGRGVPGDMLGLIFEEYQQLAPLSSPGTGLGLSIAKRTADLLGHMLAVRSTVGRGSCFSVAVPVIQA
jgi:hypothetical protein